MNPKEYYSRKDVQEELLRQAQDKEVQAWFGGVRGRRPEVVHYLGDLNDLIKQGMTSFHLSEEKWHDPLTLKPGMQKKDLDKLRKGWDCILDLDSKELSYSFIAGDLLIEALKFHDLKHYSLKFSGNHGVHIGIPFEAFPDEVNGVPIKDYFPDGIRVIAEYLKDMIKDFLAVKILEGQTIEEAAKKAGKTKEEALIDGKFNPFALVDIDSVLVSSRHLYRAAYSLNEKSGLVSIPLTSIKDFKREHALPENVQVNLKFLDKEYTVKGEAKQLLVQAFDWAVKKQKNSLYIEEQPTVPRIYELPKNAIDEKFFPPCMKLILNGLEDGKKRAVFVLINFLSQMGWNQDQIKIYLEEWNKKNKQPLPQGYISTQLDWSKKQNKKSLPANCDNQAYYKALGVCHPDEFCRTIKNPVNYAIRKSRLDEHNSKLSKRRRSSQNSPQKDPSYTS